MNRKRKMGHRILSLALSLALALPLMLFTPSDSLAYSRFNDVSGHWAEGFINRAYSLDVINGYPDGRFLPDKSVTRAEFVSMVNNAFDIDIDYDQASFSDVSYDKWYYKAVATAVTATYVSGSTDSTFRPNAPITRQEAAVMLSNILPNYKEKGKLKSFKDYKQLATWATAGMEKMIGREYFGAYSDGLLHPTAPLTRAQAAKILCDILDNETIVTRRTIVDEDKTTLSEKIYTGDVTIDEDLGDGSAEIDNCVILGTLYVEGGGSKSITINNSRVARAEVNREDGEVHVLTKGTTVIYKLTAYEKSLLQTSGKDGYGILDLEIKKEADVTLKGNFPVVNITGSKAVVALESGKVNTLTVTGGGKYSDITLTGKAQLLEATVNAEAYFHGDGVITHMSVNADDVTYETKPKKMTVATTIDRATVDDDDDVDVTFDPANRDKNVDVDTNITLTFSTSMKLVDGKAITNSNIKDFVSLKKESRSGDDVEYTAAINSAKKVITITPKEELQKDTRYYVILKDEALTNAGGGKNDEEYIYFTTRSRGGATSATFRPDDGATNVSPGTSITIRFNTDVEKAGGGSVTSAYLQECVQFRSGGAGGSALDFTASISSGDTITIKPKADLTPGQTYYVAIVAGKLKTDSGGKAIPAASATWTVAPATPATSSAAVLTGLTVAPTGTGSNVLTDFKAATTSYDVTVPFGTTGVDVKATAASGTTVSINGTVTGSALNVPVTGSAVTKITVSASGTNMKATAYTVNAQVAGNTDLTSVSVDGTTISPDSTGLYAASTAADATSAAIVITAADPKATISMDGSSGTGSLTKEITLPDGGQKATITFTVKSNMTTKTYTIQINRN
ncbi:MAG TPA: S-layer homology domain-containing protein [Bacillota bacterium]|nr:S-layer homology domain-containing protein [Bacillota bacterium]